MYIWELIDVTEKVAFQMSNNNIYLAVLMREFFRGGIFAVKIISANMPPPPPPPPPPYFNYKICLF